LFSLQTSLDDWGMATFGNFFKKLANLRKELDSYSQEGARFIFIKGLADTISDPTSLLARRFYKDFTSQPLMPTRMKLHAPATDASSTPDRSTC
jgi:hypothetical protein